MQQKLSKGDRTRHLIFTAAAKLIRRSGLSSLTYRALAQETGLTLGGIQFHVKKIDALFYESVLYIYQELEEESREFGAALVGLDYLLNLVDFNFSIFEKHPHYYSVILQSYQMVKTDKKFKKLYENFLNHSINRISEKVAIDMNTENPEMQRRGRLFAWECLLLIEASLLFTHISGKSQKQNLFENLRENYQTYLTHQTHKLKS